MRIAEESVKFTAFVTPFKQFEFLKMLFELKSAPTRFQKFVNEVVEEMVCAEDALVYIDDFLIATELLEHYLNVFKRVFKLMVENKFLRIDKCKFFTKIEYLGYSISSQDISPINSGVKAVLKFLVSQSVRNVQCFLGLCSY